MLKGGDLTRGAFCTIFVGTKCEGGICSVNKFFTFTQESEYKP
jgi:hypothetical protein